MAMMFRNRTTFPAAINELVRRSTKDTDTKGIEASSDPRSPGPPPNSFWLTRFEAAAWIGIGLTNFRLLVKSGVVPPGVRINASDRRLYWLSGEISACRAKLVRELPGLPGEHAKADMTCALERHPTQEHDACWNEVQMAG